MSNRLKMVKVYRAAGEAEAQVIKGLLESNGIYCVLKSNASSSVYVFTIAGMGEVEVMVEESAADAARNLIDGGGSRA